MTQHENVPAEAVRLGYHRAEYRVRPTDPKYAATLEPLAFVIDTGACTIMDYLTPEDAETLAGMLLAAAGRVRLEA